MNTLIHKRYAIGISSALFDSWQPETSAAEMSPVKFPLLNNSLLESTQLKLLLLKSLLLKSRESGVSL